MTQNKQNHSKHLWKDVKHQPGEETLRQLGTKRLRTGEEDSLRDTGITSNSFWFILVNFQCLLLRRTNHTTRVYCQRGVPFILFFHHKQLPWGWGRIVAAFPCGHLREPFPQSGPRLRRVSSPRSGSSDRNQDTSIRTVTWGRERLLAGGPPEPAAVRAHRWVRERLSSGLQEIPEI